MNAAVIDSSLSYRGMLEEDVLEVFRIESLAYDFPWTKEVFLDCLSAGYTCKLFCIQNVIEGYIILSFSQTDCHILNFCIAPHQQGCGYGKDMLQFAYDVAQQQGARIMYLEVRPTNAAALTLYETQGFKRIAIRKNYYPDDEGREDAFVLACEIPSTA